jgi:hypothetical protein
MPIEDLRKDKMMAHLLDSLDQGQEIGHYGHLVFTMVARHFLPDEEVVGWLAKDPACGEDQARSLVEQVQSRDYNPPKRERVLEWMERQGFPICPDTSDPSQCNVYRNLNFPEDVYQHIQQFYEERSQGAA